MRSEVIEPCPYVNGWGADNSKVAWIRKCYDKYDDHIEFQDGEPVICIRIWKQQPIMEE